VVARLRHSPKPSARSAVRVRLERPTARRRAEFLTAVRRSRRLHVPWVSPPASAAAYAAYLRRLRRPTHTGYLVCRRDTREIVGVINISEIVGGAFRSGYLGYYAFAPHAHQGLMREGSRSSSRRRSVGGACTGWKPTSSRPTVARSIWYAAWAFAARGSPRAI